MLDMITKINAALNGIVWGWPALILLAFVGVLTTCITGCFQISHFGHWMKNTIGAIFKDSKVTSHTSDRSISQFQSLCTALAATVGTGNIVGVAGAILVGGPGAVFWMWIIAFFGMMTNYSENVLGIYYRRKNEQGEWCGGAMYYLRDGLGAKKGCKQIGAILAAAFSLFCFLASFGIGNMTQVNSISGNMEAVFGVPTWVSGIVLLVLCGLVIVGGLKRIATVTEKIVPFMVLVYMVGTIAILVMNIKMVPSVFTAIFKGAFALRAAGGGIVGYGVKLAIEQGMKRGVFSNEAGLGSSVMVHSNSNVKEPVRQGMWGIFEVFADTMIVCTLTAFTVLSSGLVDLETGVAAAEYGGVALTKANVVSTVFTMYFGKLGGAFVAIAIMLFAYSTVLGWSHYGSKACEYLFGTKSTMVYRVIFVIATFGGAVMGENLAWDIADTLNGMMMIPNLIGVIVLSPIVYKITKNYVNRKIKNKAQEPMLSNFDDIQKEAAEAVLNGAE
ncbi:MAG: alanine/glycine:cation symporter family protein [Candidatus Faecousia sp.]|nr:alanine:cation symporter family protein [Clostridiales bacterium]MCI6937458.1 alanine:cation symporter family protein [Clostridiales bacterium]MDD5882482.1 alanine/glycine:cation symporter family protein [Bacillota bacterium]MDY4598418.1 alanine/glycine:cation symporter family protein [Candidatus Faecousia sp.]